MTFVTVGNATQGFERLLRAVDALASMNELQVRPVVMQTGHAREFQPRYCEGRPFFQPQEFAELMRAADLIICHGGAGTLLSAIRLGKVPVVMPRRKAYGEHVNDHQCELVDAFGSDGYVVPAREPADLPRAIIEARARRVRPPASSRMRDLVAEAIEELLHREG